MVYGLGFKMQSKRGVYRALQGVTELCSENIYPNMGVEEAVWLPHTIVFEFSKTNLHDHAHNVLLKHG